jgi:5'-nucleotidase
VFLQVLLRYCTSQFWWYADANYKIIKFGTDPNDSQIWYYNGTPAAVTFFSLDYVIPNFWNGTVPDLYVAGPNEGNNLGPFTYTLSGTVGSTYAAVERGIPGIAFSAGNATHRPYTDVKSSTDVAVLNAAAAVKVVNQLAKSFKSGSRLLPFGYGINVNLPVLNASCTNPNYVQTRLTGGAAVDKAVLNTTTNVFTFGNDFTESGINTCINGDCTLPGETKVVTGCSVSLSVFTVDYDAPTCNGATDVRGLFQELVANQNSTSPSGGSSSGGSGSSSAASSTASGGSGGAGSGSESASASPTGSSTATSGSGSSSGTSSSPAASASTNDAIKGGMSGLALVLAVVVTVLVAT